MFIFLPKTINNLMINNSMCMTATVATLATLPEALIFSVATVATVAVAIYYFPSEVLGSNKYFYTVPLILPIYDQLRLIRLRHSRDFAFDVNSQE